MTWNRLEDDFTDDPVWEFVSYPARWHYLALTEVCARHDLEDGRVQLSRAVRCSDVEKPEECLAELRKAGLIGVDDDAVTVFSVPEAHRHVLPPSKRDKQRRESDRERQERHRRHAKGDHSLCLPKNCPEAAAAAEDSATRDVTRDTGTETETGNYTPTATTESSRARAREGSGPDLNSYAPPGWQAAEKRKADHW